MREHPETELSAYLDGALPQAEAAGIAAHLTECDRCRALLDDLKVVRETLRASPVPEPHPSLLPRTLARLHGAHIQRRATRWRLAGRWAVTVVVAAAALALVVQLPVTPAPSWDEEGAVRYFRRHAEMSLTHPLAEMTLTSYLSSPLPYTRMDEEPNRRP